MMSRIELAGSGTATCPEVKVDPSGGTAKIADPAHGEQAKVEGGIYLAPLVLILVRVFLDLGIMTTPARETGSGIALTPRATWCPYCQPRVVVPVADFI
jgi:hypothetical protein